MRKGEGYGVSGLIEQAMQPMTHSGMCMLSANAIIAGSTQLQLFRKPNL